MKPRPYFTRNPPPPTPARIDAWINGWVGVPFLWDGVTRHGVDCYGLVWRFYRDLYGVDLPRWAATGRSRRWLVETFTEARETLWRPLGGKYDPLSPCLALCERGRGSHHIGIVWRGMVCHALEGARVECVGLEPFGRLFGPPQLGTIDGGRPCIAA